MILHSDRGSVYSSKAYNELIGKYSITLSMSCPGTLTDNPVIKAINGWLKDEFSTDLKINETIDVEEYVKNYFHYYNYECQTCSLDYLTPTQYKERYIFQKLSTLT